MKAFSSILKTIACVYLLAIFGAMPARAAEPTKVRWVLAHEPVGLFQRAAQRFADEIHAKSAGRLQIEVMTLSEYAAKYNGGKAVPAKDVLALLQSGQIEMSQTYTTSLGPISRDMYALDLPFLFRSHAHAKTVLEGRIGKGLLAGLANTSNVRGLAFTYSGGNRIIPAKKAITSVDDFKGMKIRTSASPVAEDTFLMLGAQPVPLDLEEVGLAVKKGMIQGAESTYPRYYSMRQNEQLDVLNDTEHSLFLTSIIVGAKFWKNLDADLQTLVSNAAVTAARLEREESIKDAVDTKEKCREAGIKVVTLSSAEQAKFKTKTAGVYRKYSDYFSPGLVEGIQKTK